MPNYGAHVPYGDYIQWVDKTISRVVLDPKKRAIALGCLTRGPFGIESMYCQLQMAAGHALGIKLSIGSLLDFRYRLEDALREHLSRLDFPRQPIDVALVSTPPTGAVFSDQGM